MKKCTFLALEEQKGSAYICRHQLIDPESLDAWIEGKPAEDGMSVRLSSPRLAPKDIEAIASAVAKLLRDG